MRAGAAEADLAVARGELLDYRRHLLREALSAITVTRVPFISPEAVHSIHLLKFIICI